MMFTVDARKQLSKLGPVNGSEASFKDYSNFCFYFAVTNIWDGEEYYVLHFNKLHLIVKRKTGKKLTPVFSI